MNKEFDNVIKLSFSARTKEQRLFCAFACFGAASFFILLETGFICTLPSD